MPTTTTYTDISTVYSTNPSTGVAWTWEQLSAVQAGVQQQTASGDEVRTTTVFVEVCWIPPTPTFTNTPTITNTPNHHQHPDHDQHPDCDTDVHSLFTPTLTPTATMTGSPTPTPLPSATPTLTATASPTATVTPSPSPTATPSPTTAAHRDAHRVTVTNDQTASPPRRNAVADRRREQQPQPRRRSDRDADVHADELTQCHGHADPDGYADPYEHAGADGYATPTPSDTPTISPTLTSIPVTPPSPGVPFLFPQDAEQAALRVHPVADLWA